MPALVHLEVHEGLANAAQPDTVHECNNMAASESASVSKLSKLERQLDPDYDEDVSDTDREKAKTKYAGTPDKDLHAKIARLQQFSNSTTLPDGGSTARNECQLLKVELKRRQAISKSWLHQVS